MDSGERAAIILVGEEGKRQSSPTHACADRFAARRGCRLFKDQTTLGQTRQRVALGFPPERTLIVVTKAHQGVYERLLSDVPPARVVIQPHDRGTAPAILYALTRLLKITPDAAVAIFPSDHYVEDDTAFMRHVDLAIEGVKVRPDLLVLLGASPNGAEVDQCWLEMGDRVAEYLRFFHLRGFWEKPHRRLAMRLWELGCLWNSSVFVAQLPVLRLAMTKVFPELCASFDAFRSRLGTESESEMAEAVYRSIPAMDFSREVLARRSDNVAVLPMAGVEWNELKPGRIKTTLRRSRAAPQRLRGTVPRLRRK
jgi:mannose-1-phosphate guanylyltransferase